MNTELRAMLDGTDDWTNEEITEVLEEFAMRKRTAPLRQKVRAEIRTALDQIDEAAYSVVRPCNSKNYDICGGYDTFREAIENAFQDFMIYL